MVIIEYPNLEGTHKDRCVQLLALHSTTQNSTPMSESSVQMLLELWQISALPAALGSLFHAHHPLVQKLFLTLNLSLSQHSSMPCQGRFRLDIKLFILLRWIKVPFSERHILVAQCKNMQGYMRRMHFSDFNTGNQAFKRSGSEDPVQVLLLYFFI